MSKIYFLKECKMLTITLYAALAIFLGIATYRMLAFIVTVGLLTHVLRKVSEVAPKNETSE